MDLEALRLARAKALLDVMQKELNDNLPYQEWHMQQRRHQEELLRIVRAIESADAALGVVSVPREATKEMLQTTAEIAWFPEDISESVLARINALYNLLLAASPLREKSDN